ncbi:hypothetical protein [Cohnella sp. OV330]|uniref:hypothetical protein n=1 Tax=Cohnella sp. OV330 TaxID=1855288 RepID=UPI001160B07A|nr:hypothetical protein [Cohnella sp. OV330]
MNTIFFQKGEGVYAAPLMPSSAKINVFCDDLFPADQWGNVEVYPADFRLSRDLFYWLLNCFTREDGRLNANIRIRSWTGFNGTTQDAVHRLSGDGERIAALLGTLAFLFTGDPFKALSLCIQYNQERLPLTIGESGNVELKDYEYEGVFANRFMDEHRKVMLTYLVYTKVLPDLLAAYLQARDEGRWNDEKREEFRIWIGHTIINRVQEVVMQDAI